MTTPPTPPAAATAFTPGPWLWPDHAISKLASRALREEHNRLVNHCAELAEVNRDLYAALRRMVQTWERNESFHHGDPRSFSDPVGQARLALSRVKESQ
jgi:hypothetical protein